MDPETPHGCGRGCAVALSSVHQKRALAGCGGLDETLVKEVHFQIKRAKVVKLQAITDGAVLESEMKPGEQELADDLAKHQLKLDVSREQNKLRAQKMLAREPVFDMRGMRCFVCAGIDDAQIAPTLARHGLVQEHDRYDADISCAIDPAGNS